MSYSRNSGWSVIAFALAIASLLNTPLGTAVANRGTRSAARPHPFPGARIETSQSIPSLPTADGRTKTRINEAFGRLPLRFESNAGQTDPQVQFISRGPGYSLFLTPTEAVMTLKAADRKSQDIDQQSATGNRQSRDVESTTRNSQSVVRMKFVNASPSPKIEGIDALPGKSNYFIGNDPRKWRRNITSYAKARYKNVYSGVDMVYYGNQQQLEYDFIVAPGADPNVIKLGFVGMDRMEVDAQGDLILHTANGDVRQRKPLAYQEVNGHRQEIASRYLLTGDREVGFDLAHFDRTRPLVIDPILIYSTVFGGALSQTPHDIAVDGAGNAYVTGIVDSSDFPTVDPFDPIKNDGNPFNFGSDAFIAKFNPAGSDLIYSTYLGGNEIDDSRSIALDRDGAIYVSGSTFSSDFPMANSLQSANGGSSDAFVTKLNAAGSALVYSTYLGGPNTDRASGMKIDTGGNVYLTGEAGPNFPTKNPLQSFAGSIDAFIAKLNAAGSALVYSTYLGGSNGDSADSIAVDSAGCAYVTGSTNSADFPTANPLQPTLAGISDTFVTKLNPNGTALVYSTYLGGSSFDPAFDIAVDQFGNAYVTGFTASPDFPTARPLQSALAGPRDIFVTKLNRAGSALVYSTYLGGNSSDDGRSITVDGEGCVYVTGSTQSPDFPNIDAIQPMPDNLVDMSPHSSHAFLIKLDAGCSDLDYSTYIGGRLEDSGWGVVVDRLGSIYVIGKTNSIDFPTTPGAFERQVKLNAPSVASTAGFILKISSNRRRDESE